MDTYIETLMDMARSAEQRMDIDERDALWAVVFRSQGYGTHSSGWSRRQPDTSA